MMGHTESFRLLDVLFIFLLTSNFLFVADSHVSLTFPPARKYDLDFLDTFRTVTPCGMYKGDIKTSIEASRPLTVTWHLGYPHRGGIKLELLDSRERKLSDLTPANEYVGGDNKALQEYVVNIPEDTTCIDCTIRLLRQALEWGPKYRFQSCANVDIVSFDDYRNDCSGHGSLRSGGICDCARTFFGDKCQYKNDCEDSSDCGNHGECIEIEGATVLPKKECYCQKGFFGRVCEKESILKEKKMNVSAKYEEIKLKGDSVKMLWRFVDDDNKQDEVEVVLIGQTTGYLALGWRPSSVDKRCQRFPEDAPAPVTSNFHDMDCQDIVIGKVRRGDLSNIGDYYTRDRSTPRRDSFYGGRDDLTAAIGWEEDGVTTIMFRKPVTGSPDSGTSDHDFTGDMLLIWAHGHSGDPFYRDDELKYHLGNRGHQDLRVSGGRILASSFLGLGMSFIGAQFIILRIILL